MLLLGPQKCAQLAMMSLKLSYFYLMVGGAEMLDFWAN